MVRRASPTVVGAFVVGALVLLVVGAFILGAGRWLSGDMRFVLNFREAVTGLAAGSPVEFRGVKVGEVREIRAVFDPQADNFYFPVEITLGADRFERLGPKANDMNSQELSAALVQRGLRARLETQSFVTGQKRIALDFFPDKPAEYAGPAAAGGLTELPTVASQTEDIANLLRAIPFERLGRDLVSVVEGLKGLVGPGTDGQVRPLSDLVAGVQETIANMERETKPLLRDGRATLASLRDVLKHSDAAIAAAQASIASIGGAAASVEQTSTEARAALRQLDAGMVQARAALTNIESLTGDESAMAHGIAVAARELGLAGRAVRVLAEELRARPDALLRGKQLEVRK